MPSNVCASASMMVGSFYGAAGLLRRKLATAFQQKFGLKSAGGFGAFHASEPSVFARWGDRSLDLCLR